MSSHDALMVASGITTVLDAVAIGDVRDGGDRLENLEKMINAIEETQKRGVNRAEHRLHLRCELPHHTTLPLFEKLVQREPVTLVSLMDHSPGQRQFANREKYREYYQGKYSLTDAQMQQYEEEQLALAARWSQPNRETIAAMCRARHIALASHDDATHAHGRIHQLGSVIAEFPTTFEAAQASRKHGMNVLMGAPNIVRGGSHSGNVAASELAQLGLLDILSSDYYPASLLDAAFRVADDESNRFTLPQAVKLVTKNPAQALNLQDRGVIGEGKRADRCWRIARATTFISTTSGVRVKGCSDDGKTDLVNGGLWLRKRQSVDGTPPAGTNSATGSASLHHARRQRRK
ncbi:hypothetical protein ECZU29_12750 [Escherichia coli]|nr:hypothetical protein ECZU29_12750 [Escherichia coli]